MSAMLLSASLKVQFAKLYPTIEQPIAADCWVGKGWLELPIVDPQ